MLEFLPPLMFIALIIFLLKGYPISFSLAATGLFFSAIGISIGHLDFALLGALSDRFFGIISNETLLAIPFFTLMGLVLERTGMAEDLLNTMGQLFGKLRGGLAYSVVFVGTMLAATTGIVSASVIAMGLISLPIMLRYGYSKRLASGVIAASGTLAQIVPPSLVLIVLGDQLGVSIGSMYKAALLPSGLLIGAYLLFIMVMTIIKPTSMPAIPDKERTLFGKELLKKVITSVIPPVTLIFLVLGTVFMGIATPTEAGAIGAVGAMILALLRKALTKDLLYQALDQSVKITTFVVFIMIGSMFFSLAFTSLNGGIWIEGILGNLPGGALGFIIAVNILIFFVAFFLDFFEIALILVPLLLPIAVALGIDLTWFGVILAMNMQTSFMHPPFGFSLFYLRSVAPKEVSTKDIYYGAIPFLILQIIMVAILIAFPTLIKSDKFEKFEGSGSDIEFNLDMGDDGFDNFNDFDDFGVDF
ncbi:TRAP transporter large permease subunit [Ignatzschineria rhizosphaerae]|uniref:TRAP transporter large permease protein n=1 Tax=Ignatzschineria rhizosphaerae TaxID=2923279 RepID=A0ABY3X4P6_9GAMM|nr:TRAP transporter large permease subunit [Ignatzschineria rhizosphaerae]UNM96679.1 TRAP transporter large permease subunit [Ignatzschineria rhizosphaerae]